MSRKTVAPYRVKAQPAPLLVGESLDKAIADATAELEKAVRALVGSFAERALSDALSGIKTARK